MNQLAAKVRVPALSPEYRALLDRISTRIAAARTRAALAANRELLRLYWQIGRDIVERQVLNTYGASVVNQLAHDLAGAFPSTQGFSARNLWRMRAFYLAYPTKKILPQLVAELEEADLPQSVADLPWAHHVLLLQRVKAENDRVWYAMKASSEGWSRNVLALQIESGLSKRQGRAVTNFARSLPPPQSDLAEQSLKDPYVLDFLTLNKEAKEKELETGLTKHVQQFLLELGVGFAFVGRQVHLEIAGEDFYLDLLFYHLKLRCYVVIELKAGPFQPEFAGKLNFYLSAVDERMRHETDGPSIGLLLCKSKRRVLVEYALRDVAKPIGVSEWKTKLVASLPGKLKGSLPTIKQLEAELDQSEGVSRSIARRTSSKPSITSKVDCDRAVRGRR